MRQTSIRIAAMLPFLFGTAAGAQVMQAGGTRPAPSPDGQRIAFSAAREGGMWDVYVVKSDGSDERRVTHFDEKNFTNLAPPAWVGRQVLVQRRVGDTTRVIMFDVNGAPIVPERAIMVPADAKQMRFSPDGKRMVFVHGNPRAPRLAVVNTDGSERREIGDTTKGAAQPAWSPDGRLIAFTMLGGSAHAALSGVGVDGSGLRTLAQFDTADGAPIWSSWSPDGGTIAVQAGKYNPKQIEESTAHIWIVDAASGRATKLGPHVARYLDETPAWMPDGRHLVFQSNRSGLLQIWTMNADGTGARQLTSWHP